MLLVSHNNPSQVSCYCLILAHLELGSIVILKCVFDKESLHVSNQLRNRDYTALLYFSDSLKRNIRAASSHRTADLICGAH